MVLRKQALIELEGIFIEGVVRRPADEAKGFAVIKVVMKPMEASKYEFEGNFDVEMAIDMVTMSERLDVVAIVSGDSDFARAVETVQSRGVRVEVIAFAGSTSIEMRALADHYLELDRVTDQLR